MMQATASPVAGVHLADPAFLADPYPAYAALRAQRVQWVQELHSWLAADYESVLELLTSRRFVRAHGPSNAGARTLQRAEDADHARLRSAVADVFHGEALGRLAVHVARLADDLVDRCCASGPVDLMSELAHPISIRTIAHVLGLPAEDLCALTTWTATIASAMGPAPSPAARSAAGTATGAIVDYIARVADARARQPRDDLASRLVGDPRLGGGEAPAMIRLLLCTGSHPMALALGNALLLVAQHDEGWGTLLERPALVPRAVEECLRFETVIQVTSRRATAPTEVAGRRLLAGDDVILLCGSANRDGAVFPRADVFDVTRSPNPHLAFGRGGHACLAPLLARLEMRAVFEALLRRRIVIRSESEPVRLTSPVLRGLERLPAQLEPIVDRGTWADHRAIRGR
jgi:cytochrome P450